MFAIRFFVSFKTNELQKIKRFDQSENRFQTFNRNEALERAQHIFPVIVTSQQWRSQGGHGGRAPPPPIGFHTNNFQPLLSQNIRKRLV